VIIECARDPVSLPVCDRLRELMRQAVEHSHGTTTEYALVEGIYTGKYVLWTGTELGEYVSMAVTQVTELEGMGRVCVILACAGRHPEQWTHGLQAIEAEAQRNGCVKVVVYGRQGWARKLKPMNYELASIVLTKELEQNS